MVASRSHKAGEEQEKERHQPHGPKRREWWQVKATTSGEKSRRSEGSSKMIGPTAQVRRLRIKCAAVPKRAETQQRNSTTACPEARTRPTAPVGEAGAKGPAGGGLEKWQAQTGKLILPNEEKIGGKRKQDGSRSRRTGRRSGTVAPRREQRLQGGGCSSTGGAPVLVPPSGVPPPREIAAPFQGTPWAQRDAWMGFKTGGGWGGAAPPFANT